ncbi:isochorismate synthase [Balneicella halophila]|uniref:isochorismate synthase n=1 Tax=Balneicella halophila TaxID=1537566 RepID=A0A7L4UP58_BALHA|nr:chorismate-binding protein [Balneicella halophila]PVX50905.1 isochorismate synthase [Balneicella halophila]
MLSPQFAYLEHAVANSKPFVAYRLPDELEAITLILNEESVIEVTDFDTLQHDSGFIFTPFDPDKNKSYFIKPEEIIKGDKGFRGDLFLKEMKIPSKKHQLDQNEETKNAYTQQFQEMLRFLKDDILQKIILSRTLTVKDLPKDEQIYIYHNLITQYPQAMVYWLHLPHLGIEWMGATPELLVSKKNDQFHTLALAGTKKSGESWTPKEIEEQQMVADYIKKQLLDFDPVISQTETISTGTVEHLATHFTLSKNKLNLFDIIEKIHPTPAICGLPQDKAFKIIRDVEKHQRNYYCGFLGPINLAETTATFVNLRCMELANHSVRLYVGGGLTKDSDLEREWQETERKAETLRKFIL